MVMPAPVQARALETIRRAIEVAADLVDRHGEDGVRLQDVTTISGVSAGSLTHHFGSREGLIAAALMERYDRAARERARTFELDPADPERFAAAMAAMVASSAAGERDAWRLVRIRALSFARHRPELRAALVVSLAQLERDMAARLEALAAQRSPGADFDVRALVVFSENYSAGRIVDSVFGDPLPMQDWAALFARLMRSIVAEPIVERTMGGAGSAMASGAPAQAAPGPSTRGRQPAAADASGAGVRAPRPDIPRLTLDANERRMLDAAREVQRAHGTEAVRVRDLVERTGLSRSWFARHFGEREEIVDYVHLCNTIGYARRETELLEAAFDGATDVPDLACRLSGVVRGMSAPDVLGGAWNRLEMIALAASRPWLAQQATSIVRATLERLTDTVAGAQERGLVHPDVPPRAVARFLWAAPLTYVLGEVAHVDWDQLHALSERTLGTLLAEGA